MALGAALEPKQNPDGTWVFNTALSTLSLSGTGPDPASSSCMVRVSVKAASP